MKKVCFLLLSIFMYGNCSSGNSNDPNANIPFYEDALTFVLSFGDDNVPDDEWEPYLVDVIDAGTGNLVSRTTFNFIPDIIKDGFAYRLIKPNDEFPTIEKYRVNPAVYRPR